MEFINNKNKQDKFGYKKNNMFKRNYTLHFKKAQLHIDLGSWDEVTDAYILSVLLDLCKRYDFEVVSTNFKDAHYKSKLVIKCDKETKNKVFMELCINLKNYIENVKY